MAGEFKYHNGAGCAKLTTMFVKVKILNLILIRFTSTLISLLEKCEMHLQ